MSVNSVKKKRPGRRIDIGSIRREQIVEAAVAVIAEQGLQNLSLSEIQNKVGMARGQLTYYFKTKEDILLAVFDHLLEMICHQHGVSEEKPFPAASWFEAVGILLEMILCKTPLHPEFHALHHTFVAQTSHRADFRQRIARLYEDWRNHMAGHLSEDLKLRPAVRPVSPRALATMVQAIFHGLAMQNAADPEAINSEEIVNLCLDMLGIYLWGKKPNKPLGELSEP